MTQLTDLALAKFIIYYFCYYGDWLPVSEAREMATNLLAVYDDIYYNGTYGRQMTNFN